MHASASAFRNVLILRFGTPRFSTGVSAVALATALVVAAPAHAQVSTNVPDPAQSTGSSGNPNESGSAQDRKADNAAVTGEATPQEDPAAEDAEGPDIVVTGFRQSLENAVAEKKNRDQIVESVSAEDIGKLPDPSIAEAIARLPGLTSQRINGRSNSISIRGFAPDFSSTLLNGREQTSTGDNRAVEYDQYPSEVVSQVLVYKTANAALIGQGLSGTVDLRTIRPLDYGRSVLAVTGRGTYAELGKLNSGSEELGYRVSGTFVDQFADDTIGVALAASFLDEPYQVEEFNAWGYFGINDGQLIGGSKSYVTSTKLKRLGLQGTVQWRPTPELTATFDGFYSDFDDDQIRRGIEFPLAFDFVFGRGPFDADNVGSRFDAGSGMVTDGVYSSGRFSNVKGVVRNDVIERTAKLYSFGYNAKYQGDDGWNAQFDVSYSRTDRNELIFETYAGTGYGLFAGAVDTLTFETDRQGTTLSPTLDYGDPNLIKLTDPRGWQGGTLAAGYYNDREVRDAIQQYRAEVEKELETPVSAIRAGLNYTRRRKSLAPEEAFVVLSNGAAEQVLPEEYRLRPTSQEYSGIGDILSYDPAALLAGGVYTLRPNFNGDVAAKAFDIAEDVMTAYAQADIRQPIGAAELTGNIGLQTVWTTQKSSGLVFTGASFSDLTAGDDYTDVLPSLNLSLRFPSDFVVRFGAARQMQRPRLDDMRIALNYSYDPNQGILTGNGGNPFLRPIRADAFDLTFEKYFGTRGYLAVQTFHKKLKTFNYNLEIPYDYTGFPLPENAPPAGVPGIGLATVPINGDGGEIYGVEVAGTLPFGEFVRFLDGFGVTGGGSYTKTKISPTPGAPSEDIPGYSRWVANGTAFFEKWGLNLRGSVRYRSTFVGELSGFAANRVRRRAAGEMIIDGQVGYEFQEGSALRGLSVFVQGQNLTKEPFVTLNAGVANQVIDYQQYGRRFLAGASIKF